MPSPRVSCRCSPISRSGQRLRTSRIVCSTRARCCPADVIGERNAARSHAGLGGDPETVLDSAQHIGRRNVALVVAAERRHNDDACDGNFRLDVRTRGPEHGLDLAGTITVEVLPRERFRGAERDVAGKRQFSLEG